MEERREITNWKVSRMWWLWLYQRGYDQCLLYPEVYQADTGPTVDRAPTTKIAHDQPPLRGSLFPIPSWDRGSLLYTCAIGGEGLNFIHYAFSFSGDKSEWPNLTDSCWLCLLYTLPFYEASGIRGGYLVEDSPSKCRWEDRAETHPAGLIFPLDMTNMTCVLAKGASEPNWGECHVFNQTQGKWLVPKEHGTFWLCQQTELTHCISLDTMLQWTDACAMVTLLPHVLYHSNEEMMIHSCSRVWREPLKFWL